MTDSRPDPTTGGGLVSDALPTRSNAKTIHHQRTVAAILGRPAGIPVHQSNIYPLSPAELTSTATNN
jgi:hypothetical protein